MNNAGCLNYISIKSGESQANSLTKAPSDKSDCSFKNIYFAQLNKSQGLASGINNAQVQAKFNQDIKRIAQLMGIGPQTLLKFIGKLNIDPQNYDFKISSQSDAAVDEIARYFSISPMTMLAIFDKLGISRKDITDKEKSGEIISKLKEFFGLNIQQEKDISKILEEYKKVEEE